MNQAINGREIRIIGMQRSGNHAIINWIIRQAAGSLYFLSDVQLAQNPYLAMEEFEHYVSGKLVCRMTLYTEDDLAKFKTSPYFDDASGRFAQKDFLVFNYEDKSPSRINTKLFEEHHDEWLGTSGQRLDVLVLRDPYNLFASRLRARGILTGIKDLAQSRDLWKEHAREYLRLTRVLPDRAIMVNYNQWGRDAAYRERLAKSLGLAFTDAGFQEVYAGVLGSSFDAHDYNGRAQEMKVYERWKHYKDNHEYRNLFRDQELNSLSDSIFGAVPGIEAVREARHEMAARLPP